MSGHFRLSLVDLESDLRRVREAAGEGSDDKPSSCPPSYVQVTREVLLVRQIALLDDIITSRACRGAEDAGDSSEVLERRAWAVRELLSIRKETGHERDVVAERVGSPPDSLLEELEAASTRVMDAKDEERYR